MGIYDLGEVYRVNEYRSILAMIQEVKNEYVKENRYICDKLLLENNILTVRDRKSEPQYDIYTADIEYYTSRTILMMPINLIIYGNLVGNYLHIKNANEEKYRKLSVTNCPEAWALIVFIHLLKNNQLDQIDNLSQEELWKATLAPLRGDFLAIQRTEGLLKMHLKYKASKGEAAGEFQRAGGKQGKRK